MTDLPPGWVRTKLGDVCSIVSGATPKTTEPEYWNGNIPWITPDDLSRSPSKVTFHGRRFLTQRGYDSCSTQMIPPGAVLFSSRAPIGYVTIAGAPVCTNQGFKTCIPPSGVDSTYLYWYLQFKVPEIRSRASGTTFKEISAKGFADTELLIPPLAEQRRIVDALEDHLSRLDAAVTQIVNATIRLNRLRDRVMAAACTGSFLNLISDGQASLPVPAGVIDGELPRIPADWTWMRLGELAEVVGGVTKDTKKQSNPDLPSVPYLRVANVQRARLNLEDIAYIRVPEEKARQLALQPGDVLLNEGGDRDKLGRGWIWEGQIPGCIHQNHVFRARIKDRILHPKLLAWHANGFGRTWFERNGKQSVNLASISLSKIKLFPVPVPPAHLQEEMVAETERNLSALDNVESLVHRSLIRAKHLRRSLLADAFAGRLVPQDPDDEPASVLLERIKAEWAAVRTPKRRDSRTGPKTGGTRYGSQTKSKDTLEQGTLI